MKRGYERLDVHIYFAQMGGEDGPIKIGRSGDPELRVKQLAASLPFPLRILATHRGSSYYIAGRTTEKHLHWEFRESRLNGEWFAPSDDVLRYVRFVATEHGRAMVEREIADEARTDKRTQAQVMREEACRRIRGPWASGDQARKALEREMKAGASK